MTTEIRCRRLDVAELASELAFIHDDLMRSKIESVDVMYGWACEVEDDVQWKAHPTPVGQLLEFIDRSRSTGRFVLGASDLHIGAPDGKFEIVLCHESDVHYRGPSEEVDRFRCRWEAKGFRPYVVKDERPPPVT